MILIVLLTIFLVNIVDVQTCTANIDLILMVDSSGSISSSDFEKAKAALIDIVSRLDISTNSGTVGIINYASDVNFSGQTNIFDSDKIQLYETIASLQRLGTLTATGEALSVAKSFCENTCRDLAEGIPRIFVIITDGHSNYGRSILPIATEIRELPIAGTIFAVGIGDIGFQGQNELIGIAGDRDYALHIDSYTKLLSITNLITNKICDFPAFILPNFKKASFVLQNQTHYYKMETLFKLGQSTQFEIEFHDNMGQSDVYISTSNKKPTSTSIETITRRTATGAKIYTTFVPANAKNFYFSVKGIQENMNEYDFVVHVRPTGFS